MFINTYQLGVCYGDIGLQNCHSFTYPRLFLSDILYFVPRVQQFTCNNRRAEKDHQSIGSSQGLFSRKSFNTCLNRFESEHFKLAEANGYNLTCGFVMPLPENRVIFNISEHFDIAEEEPSSKFPKAIVLFTLFGLTLLVICLILIKCL